ncbi:alpha-N-acetylgalactosaminide alpha-2,6-sialyltransferase 5 [Lepisosteus oculatus]|uniref:Alpha-N-acetylgalactosaminide alpha-2,6-sialyltransferase 5 n=1 Tax=Lepisosteus oculatus TaxID=7918 RepID=W5M768_LEPOC|nr:PREDICTED: alpha-N-acetylgalactosaminide alpha-2,6-sialyltransferase 5 [Lepisosteus oculatus]
MKTPMRHGIAVFLAITMCTSLLLVYNSSYSNTQKLQNDSESREHQPTKLVTKPPRDQLSPLQGYSSIIDHKPLKMHCDSCALVTSSGHLIGSGRGEEIDQTECVIRMNDAPTRSYRKDVGQKTSLRVIAHSSMQRILRNHNELLNTSQDTVFIFWGPSNYMRRDGKGLVYNNLRVMNQVLPRLKVYIISRQKMQQFDELFKRETGKDRRISNSWLSTGWFTMTIALELCDRINVYGMVAPEFCKEPHHLPVPYHYYEPAGPDECTMYISHERGRRGSHHRFITEKRVFAKWARTFDIRFYQPDWSPAPAPGNRTAGALPS